jgi:hypothetical protein
MFQASISQSQAQTTHRWWSKIWEKTQVRQNTDVKKDIAKPAFVTFTVPKASANTYQIGLGVLSPLVSKTLFKVDALVDYQRNNAIDEGQNTFKAGATGEWQLRAMEANGRRNSGLVSFRGNFKNDALKTSKGWQAAVGYTHLFEGSRAFPHPNEVFPFGNALDLVYFPYVGLEFDRIAQAQDPLAEGSVTRAVGQFSLALYPAPITLRRRLEFIAGYTYQADLKDSTNETDNRHPLLTFESNIFPFKSDRGDVGFGASYTQGEDPDAGYKHQQYWQFSIRVRLK